MSAKETDINTMIGKVITRSQAIEKLLRTHYKLPGRGLHKAIDDLSETLPAVLTRTIRIVATVRNVAAHPDGFEAKDIPTDFERLCGEIEILIPYFANQLHTKLAESPKKPKNPVAQPQKTAPTGKPVEPTSSDVIKLPVKPPLPPWSPAELKQLVDGFEAKIAIPEIAKALNRSISSTQRKLIKLGKLAADEAKTYPADLE